MSNGSTWTHAGALVNTAKAVCDGAHGGTILLSDSTVQELGDMPKNVLVGEDTQFLHHTAEWLTATVHMETSIESAHLTATCSASHLLHGDPHDTCTQCWE